MTYRLSENFADKIMGLVHYSHIKTYTRSRPTLIYVTRDVRNGSFHMSALSSDCTSREVDETSGAETEQFGMPSYNLVQIQIGTSTSEITTQN